MTRPPPLRAIRTLGDLRASVRAPESVRDEIRRNLIAKLARKEPLFPGIVGFDETVVPQFVNALLSRHNVILLGLRGQAKTRLLRALVEFLDEEVPVVPGCPLNSHPLAPLTKLAKRQVLEHGDALELGWLPRRERYREKLATPDITIADLIGDVDPIKAASERRALSDEEVIHYGIIPRTNRGVFAINELPDLPTRIQVGLLNLLEEKDVQIRGFPIRLPLDVLLVFSANPEDYTNRGNIITPLRDRIESQIHTHYPLTLEHGLAITAQEAWVERGGNVNVKVTPWLRELLEEVALAARGSSFVDQNSGVSARMTIALLENVLSNAERRALLAGAKATVARPADVFAALPAVSGKIELVYEGEREGPVNVARALIGQAMKAVFDRVFPDPYQEHAGAKLFEPVLKWFQGKQRIVVSDAMPASEWLAELSKVPELAAIAQSFLPGGDDETRGAAMELILEGLHQASLLNKTVTVKSIAYTDAFDDMVEGLRGKPGAGGPGGPGKKKG